VTGREPPPKKQATLGVPPPYQPAEDDTDAQVRADLDRWAGSGQVRATGVDGPRLFAATRTEALQALRQFVDERLATFGRHEDAMMAGDWAMHRLADLDAVLEQERHRETF